MGVQFKVYEGSKPYIFISYARKDKDLVFPVLYALYAKGYRIWRDEGGIPLGVEWMKIIQDHLDQAEVCLVFWSEASAASENCEAEIGEIIKEQKRVITIYLDDTPVTTGPRMYLQRFQSVKFSDFGSADEFAESLAQEKVLAPCKAVPQPIIEQHTGEATPESSDEETMHPMADNPADEETMQPPAHDPSDEGAMHTPAHDPSDERAMHPTAHNPQIRWNKDDEIQWYLDKKGTLTIAKDANLRNYSTVFIPDYNKYWLRWCPRALPRVIPTNEWVLNFCFNLNFILHFIINSIWNFFGKRRIAPWSSLMREIYSVVIQNDINRISDSAFDGYGELMSVTIPDSVTSIGDRAFFYCFNLTSVTIL